MTALFPRSPALSRLIASLRAPVVVADPSVRRLARLVLRPLVVTDRTAFLELLRESRCALESFFPLHHPGETDEQVFERQLAFAHGALTTGRAVRRVICLYDGTLIGAVNINNIASSPQRSAELNFWITPRFHAMGFASEGVGAMIEHAFAPAPAGLGLARLWAYAAPDNARCLRLLSRLGFERAPGSQSVQLDLAGCWKAHEVYQRPAPFPAAGVAPRPPVGVLRYADT